MLVGIVRLRRDGVGAQPAGAIRAGGGDGRRADCIAAVGDVHAHKLCGEGVARVDFLLVLRRRRGRAGPAEHVGVDLVLGAGGRVRIWVGADRALDVRGTVRAGKADDVRVGQTARRRHLEEAAAARRGDAAEGLLQRLGGRHRGGGGQHRLQRRAVGIGEGDRPLIVLAGRGRRRGLWRRRLGVQQVLGEDGEVAVIGEVAQCAAHLERNQHRGRALPGVPRLGGGDELRVRIRRRLGEVNGGHAGRIVLAAHRLGAGAGGNVRRAGKRGGLVAEEDVVDAGLLYAAGSKRADQRGGLGVLRGRGSGRRRHGGLGVGHDGRGKVAREGGIVRRRRRRGGGAHRRQRRDGHRVQRPHAQRAAAGERHAARLLACQQLRRRLHRGLLDKPRAVERVGDADRLAGGRRREQAVEADLGCRAANGLRHRLHVRAVRRLLQRAPVGAVIVQQQLGAGRGVERRLARRLGHLGAQRGARRLLGQVENPARRLDLEDERHARNRRRLLPNGVLRLALGQRQALRLRAHGRIHGVLRARVPAPAGAKGAAAVRHRAQGGEVGRVDADGVAVQRRRRLAREQRGQRRVQRRRRRVRRRQRAAAAKHGGDGARPADVAGVVHAQGVDAHQRAVACALGRARRRRVGLAGPAQRAGVAGRRTSACSRQLARRQHALRRTQCRRARGRDECNHQQQDRGKRRHGEFVR